MLGKIDYSPLKDLTVVVLTYNRFAFLERELKFYLQYFPDKNIVVLDSSHSDVPPGALKEMLARVTYKRFSADTFFTTKIAQGLGGIQTRYCAISPDDDFLLPGALLLCMRFLDGNPEYVSAHGHALGHTLKEGKNGWKFFAGPLNCWAPSIEEETPEDRLKRFFPRRYAGYPFHAVHRTQDLYSIWARTASRIEMWGLGEIVPVCLSVIYGKTKILPIFYMSRELNLYQYLNADDAMKLYTDERLACAVTVLLDALHEKGSQATPAEFVKALFNEYREDEKKRYQTKGQKSFGERLLNKCIYLLDCARIGLFALSSHEFAAVKQAVVSAGLNPKALEESRRMYLPSGG